MGAVGGWQQALHPAAVSQRGAAAAAAGALWVTEGHGRGRLPALLPHRSPHCCVAATDGALLLKRSALRSVQLVPLLCHQVTNRRE